MKRALSSPLRALFFCIFLIAFLTNKVSSFGLGRKKKGGDGVSHRRNRGKHGGNVYHEHLNKGRPAPAPEASTASDPTSGGGGGGFAAPANVELSPRIKSSTRSAGAEDFVEDKNEELESKDEIMEDFASKGGENRDGEETLEEDEEEEKMHSHAKRFNNRSGRGHFHLRGSVELDNGVKLVPHGSPGDAVTGNFDELDASTNSNSVAEAQAERNLEKDKIAAATLPTALTSMLAPATPAAPAALAVPIAAAPAPIVPEAPPAPVPATPETPAAPQSIVESVTAAVVGAEKAVEAVVTAPIAAVASMFTSSASTGPAEFPSTGVTGSSSSASATSTYAAPGALPSGFVAAPVTPAVPEPAAPSVIPAALSLVNTRGSLGVPTAPAVEAVAPAVAVAAVYTAPVETTVLGSNGLPVAPTPVAAAPIAQAAMALPEGLIPATR